MHSSVQDEFIQSLLLTDFVECPLLAPSGASLDQVKISSHESIVLQNDNKTFSYFMFVSHWYICIFFENLLMLKLFGLIMNEVGREARIADM